MWVARVPVARRQTPASAHRVAPHVGGASARYEVLALWLGKQSVAPHVGGASARRCLYAVLISYLGRTPCGWRECPFQVLLSDAYGHRSHPMWVARVPVHQAGDELDGYVSSHPMWVARVPVKSGLSDDMFSAVAPHVGGASARDICRGMPDPVQNSRTPCGWRECP